MEQAQVLCSGHLPPPGYMRAVNHEGQIGWLKCLKVSQVLVFEPVQSFAPGVGVGSLRRMVY